MSRKLPLEAFEYYASLGPGRSYQAVARHFKVAKGTVVQRAKKEGWPERIRAMEREAREESNRRARDAIAAVRERQLKETRYVQAKALKAMADATPKDAVKIAGALNIAWKHELTLLGDPQEQKDRSVPEMLSDLFHSCMRPAPGGEAGGDGERAEREGDDSPPPAPEDPPRPARDQPPPAPGKLTLRDIVYEPEAE